MSSTVTTSDARTTLRPVPSSGTTSTQSPNSEVPLTLTLITQLPEFRHLCFAQRRPAAEEDGHALVATVTRILELRAVECRQFRGQVLNHGGKASGHYDAPAPGPNSTPTRLSLSPNRLRI